MAFTDFPNGLSSAADYLTNNQSANAQLSTSVANVGRFMVSAELDANLKEIICSLLAGRGLKLPNIQICISLNLKELLANTIGVIQQVLYDALARLDQVLDKFLDHLKIDQVLGRINNVLGEITQIANMINFCSAPINPVAIPNVLRNAMESFLGKGKEIIDSIGNIIPSEIGGCLLPGGGFNRGIWRGGIFGKIDENWDNFIGNGADPSWIDSIIADINKVENDINSLISRENKVTTNYDQGGSDLAESPRTINEGIGTLYNASEEGIRGAVDVANKLHAIEQVTGGYPLVDDSGRTYSGPLELICDEDLLRILRRPSNPTPDIAEQVPIFNYCGEIVGYQRIESQSNQEVSVGLPPGTINQPGFNAGGLPTSPINEAIAGEAALGGGTVINQITNVTNLDGSVIIVDDEAGLLSSGSSLGQLVYRTDIDTLYVDNGGTSNTIADYEVVGGGSSSGSLGPFLTTVNSSTGLGIMVRNFDTPLYRTLQGTATQITISNGNGTLGNPTIALASNPIIPGTDSAVVPAGTTAQRVSTTNGAIRYNSTIGRFEGYQSGAWQSFATGTSSVTGGANVGAGTIQVFKQNNLGTLEFRTISAGGAITMGVASDVITVSESLVGASLGTGSDVFKSRVSNTFQFRSLSAGEGITLTENTDDIEISADFGRYTGNVTTTTSGLTEVLFDSLRRTPGANKVWFFKITAVANRQGSSDATAIKLEGLIDNTSGTVTVVGTAGNKTIYNSTAGTANYDLTVTVSSNQIVVSVQGDTGHTVDWTVRYEFIEA
jgi:hypothetical protein